MLRGKKILQHVVERLPKGAFPEGKSAEDADELFELVCKGQSEVIPPKMTLASVKNFMWRQSSDVVIVYRYKKAPAKT